MKIDPETNERIYDLVCDCGEKGGEVRFPANDPRTDEELTAHCDDVYVHSCDAHGA